MTETKDYRLVIEQRDGFTRITYDGQTFMSFKEFDKMAAEFRDDERERIAQACEVAANYLTSMDILDDTLAEARGLYRAAKIARNGG